MRIASLSTLRIVLPSLFLAAATVLGCSVSLPAPEETDADADESTKDDDDTKKPDVLHTDPAPSSTVAPPPSSTVAPPPSSTVAPPPSGTVTPPPPPPSGTVTPPPPPPSTKCLPTSLQEAEPNDTDATANDLGASTSFCGTINPGEVDFVSFTLPADAKGLSYGSSWDGFGNPVITLTSEGVTTSPPTAPPFNKGKRYVFKVAGGTSKLDYVISVNIVR